MRLPTLINVLRLKLLGICISFVYCQWIDRDPSREIRSFHYSGGKKNSPWPLSEKSERTCTIKYGVQGDGSIGDKVTVESCDPFRDLRTAIGQKKKNLFTSIGHITRIKAVDCGSVIIFQTGSVVVLLNFHFFSCFARLSICTV
jgi:hypothetical protein